MRRVRIHSLPPGGTGESAEDLQPLARAELEQEYRVEECDGLLWVYDRQTGELVFLFEKGLGG